MSGAIAVLIFILAGAGYLVSRSLGRALRRRRPGLPPPDRATVRDCFNPVPRH